MVIDILFLDDYGNWEIYVKQSGMTKPFGFYCKHFPYGPNRYLLFEKWTWTLCEAIKHLGFSVNNHYLIVQTSVPILDWITMEEASLPGLLWNLKFYIGNGTYKIP